MEPDQKRKSLRNLSYGVYVLTVNSGDDYAGATVTWVSQASLDPPKIMIGLRRGSKTTTLVKEVKEFALNIVGEAQKNIASAFLKHAIIAGEKINGFSFKTERTKAPILTEVPSYLECRIDEYVEGSDHDIVVAEVINAVVQSDALPLEMRSTGWKYGG